MFAEDTIQELRVEVETLTNENEKLKKAIRHHRDQQGDDRCWLDDQELYDVLGEGMAETALPPREKFLSNCARYFDCRQDPSDKYVTVAEQVEPLVDKNKKLLAKIEKAKDGIKHIKKNALWGVEVNCDAVLAELEKA